MFSLHLPIKLLPSFSFISLGWSPFSLHHLDDSPSATLKALLFLLPPTMPGAVPCSLCAPQLFLAITTAPCPGSLTCRMCGDAPALEWWCLSSLTLQIWTAYLSCCFELILFLFRGRYSLRLPKGRNSMISLIPLPPKSKMGLFICRDIIFPILQMPAPAVLGLSALVSGDLAVVRSFFPSVLVNYSVRGCHGQRHVKISDVHSAGCCIESHGLQNCDVWRWYSHCVGRKFHVTV